MIPPATRRSPSRVVLEALSGVEDTSSICILIPQRYRQGRSGSLGKTEFFPSLKRRGKLPHGGYRRFLNVRRTLLRHAALGKSSHVCVHNRCQIQRNRLRKQKAAHNRQTERLARFAAGAVTESDRQRSEQGRHSCHHNRAEP